MRERNAQPTAYVPGNLARLVGWLAAIVAIVAGWLWTQTASAANQCASILVSGSQTCQHDTTYHAAAGYVAIVAAVVFIACLISRRRARSAA